MINQRLNNVVSGTTSPTRLNNPMELSNNVQGRILDRNFNKLKGQEVHLSSFCFLFSEIIQLCQRKVTGITDLEKKLSDIGQRVGVRVLELIMSREKVVRRELTVINQLYFVNTVVWKYLFNKAADSLEKSTDQEDEYMISDNDPVLTQFISIPKELNQLNCNAFLAGLVESIMRASQFPCRVTAHSNPLPNFPQRTTILIKFDPSVIEREAVQNLKS